MGAGVFGTRLVPRRGGSVGRPLPSGRLVVREPSRDVRRLVDSIWRREGRPEQAIVDIYISELRLSRFSFQKIAGNSFLMTMGPWL